MCNIVTPLSLAKVKQLQALGLSYMRSGSEGTSIKTLTLLLPKGNVKGNHWHITYDNAQSSLLHILGLQSPVPCSIQLGVVLFASLKVHATNPVVTIFAKLVPK
jgi:hypothetical protein